MNDKVAAVHTAPAFAPSKQTASPIAKQIKAEEPKPAVALATKS